MSRFTRFLFIVLFLGSIAMILFAQIQLNAGTHFIKLHIVLSLSIDFEMIRIFGIITVLFSVVELIDFLRENHICFGNK